MGLVGELVYNQLNNSRIICHYICLLQFNKLSGSESHATRPQHSLQWPIQAFCNKILPLHAIFGALFVSLFLIPVQLKHDHYTL